MTEPTSKSLPPLEIRTLREGHGRPILLLHAFPLDHRMWHAVAAAMPIGRTVLAVDSYGSGSAPDGPSEPSLAVIADAIVIALRTAGFGRVTVAGLSMGGYIALALAERHPDVIAGLGLLDTKSTPDSDETRASRMATVKELLSLRSVNPILGMAAAMPAPESVATDPTLTSRIEEQILAQRPEGMAWCQRAMAVRPDRTAAITNIPCPVLILVGEKDRYTTISHAEHMVVARRDAEFVIVPNVGHFSPIEAPAAVAAALAQLASRSDPA